MIANIFEFVGLAVIAYYIFGSPLPRFDDGDDENDEADDDDDDDDYDGYDDVDDQIRCIFAKATPKDFPISKDF